MITKEDIDKALASSIIKDPVIMSWGTGFCIIDGVELRKLPKGQQSRILNMPNMKPHKNLRRKKL